MSGQQFHDVLAMATLGTVGPKNATRIAADANGALWVSIKGAQFIPLASAVGANPIGFGFVDETLALAKVLMPDVGFDRKIGTDFMPIWEASLSGTVAPAIDGFFNGGVVAFNGGGVNQVALNPVSPGSTTYNPIIGNAFQTRATPWFARAKLLVNATGLTPGTTEMVLLSMDGSYVGGPGITHQIQLVGMSSVSLNQFQIRIRGNNTTPTAQNFSLGADGFFGGDNSLFPINQWFTVSLYFDGSNLRWAFSDYYRPTPFNPLSGSVGASAGNFLDATIGQMDGMPQDAAAVTVNSSPTPDITIGAAFRIDAFACAYCATQENKYSAG